ncbi:MAG: hypothetical protein ACM31J_03075 [Nitrososphaerales archaeon]
MEKLSSTSSPSAKPSGLAEGDEFYINAGPKGSRYHEKIVKPGRKPSKRGLKQWKLRGTFFTDHQMIT